MSRLSTTLGIAVLLFTTTSTCLADVPVWAPTEYGAGENRDPFVDPRRAELPGPESDGPRPDGLAGQRVGEVRLRGVSRFRGEPLALLEGSDGIGYVGRQGAMLWNGRIERIDFERGEVVFARRTSDRTDPDRYRLRTLGLRP